ncbi:uncharacterized protein [Elaeis guineensis]|uniref:Uncharacterized protein LOC105040522 n=1 Tax=Elaeis guineensis var. tenera TaxID=51953 RepID=A0A6J0PGG9_ELAGV|nr:uncharacterized protein LOC105040522 [Elaeis guineensis]
MYLFGQVHCDPVLGRLAAGRHPSPLREVQGSNPGGGIHHISRKKVRYLFLRKCVRHLDYSSGSVSTSGLEPSHHGEYGECFGWNHALKTVVLALRLGVYFGIIFCDLVNTLK